jgi:hypothetical protein
VLPSSALAIPHAPSASRIAATTACGFSMCAMCPTPSTMCIVAALPRPAAFAAGTILSSRPRPRRRCPERGQFPGQVDGGLVALDKVLDKRSECLIHTVEALVLEQIVDELPVDQSRIGEQPAGAQHPRTRRGHVVRWTYATGSRSTAPSGTSAARSSSAPTATRATTPAASRKADGILLGRCAELPPGQPEVLTTGRFSRS